MINRYCENCGKILNKKTLICEACGMNINCSEFPGDWKLIEKEEK